MTSLEFKRGGKENISVQFGRSAADGAGVSVVSSPDWTAEQLGGSAEIWVGIKDGGDYEGDPLALIKVSAWDATNEWYNLALDLNTTELNAALLHDDTEDNDIASITDGMFEVKYRDSSSDPWHASINQVTAIIYHNVLDGDEATPSSAADPEGYVQGFQVSETLTSGQKTKAITWTALASTPTHAIISSMMTDAADTHQDCFIVGGTLTASGCTISAKSDRHANTINVSLIIFTT